MSNFKRIQFLKSYISRQNWSLPNSVIYYILKNPSNSKVYQKLIQSCKYFFVKNPILIVNEKLNTWNANGLKFIPANNISSKLWIINEMSISSRNVNGENTAFSIIPKIFKCEVQCLRLRKQIILLNQLLFLALNVQKIILDCTTVKNENGSVLEFEKIVEFFPKVETFIYIFSSNPNITSKSVKKLLQIPHFSKINLSLWNVPEIFDIDNFYSYIKKNKYTKIHLDFRNVSDTYKIRLEKIIDEIVENKNREYNIPVIFFPGLNQQKMLKMHKLLTLGK